MLTRQGVRPLGSADVETFCALAERDPVVNVFALYRAQLTRLEPRWLGGEMWGRFDRGELVSAFHVGANLVPVQAEEDDAQAFAERALTRGRTVSTIVGPQPAVRTMWDCLSESWGRPRELRWDQPHLELTGPPMVEPDPGVRRTRMTDASIVYPACVAMYTEEVGVSPELGGGADLYRARVAQLVAKGWSFARIESGRVVFKAEVAAASPYACQVQGVYVDPARRGEGLAAAGMAAVVHLALASIAPVVSLYVNEHNVAARRAYARAGFEQTGTFSTIMF